MGSWWCGRTNGWRSSGCSSAWPAHLVVFDLLRRDDADLTA
jgi:hypothetical protein